MRIQPWLRIQHRTFCSIYYKALTLDHKPWAAGPAAAAESQSMPSGAILKEEGTVPPMPPGTFVKGRRGAVPPMPPDAIVKVEVVVP